MTRPAFWLVPLVLLFSMGAPEVPSWTGELAVVGNEPFTYLALTDRQGRQWRLSGDAVAQLRQTGQGRWVKVTGQPAANDGILVATWAWAPGEEKNP